VINAAQTSTKEEEKKFVSNYLPQAAQDGVARRQHHSSDVECVQRAVMVERRHLTVPTVAGSVDWCWRTVGRTKAPGWVL